MRTAAVAIAFLMLAGCSSPAADEPSSTTPPAGAPRVARGGTNSGVDEPPHTDITFFSAPLDYEGPGPATFTATVPENVTHVSFLISPGTFRGHDSLRVLLDGCGEYSEPGYGSYGGGTTSGLICADAAQPGSHAVELYGTILLFVGCTLTLTGWQLIGNTTAAPQS